MDWFSIIFIAMIVSAVPLGLIANHFATKRAARIKAERYAERKAACDRMESQRLARQRSREELRLMMGGRPRNSAGGSNSTTDLRASKSRVVTEKPASSRSPGTSYCEPETPVQSYYRNGGSDIGDGLLGGVSDLMRGASSPEPMIGSGGTFDGGGASGDWSSSSSSSSSSDSCSSSSDSSSSGSDSGSCSSGGD